MQKLYKKGEAPYFYDSYGIMVCECPKCKEFYPNVKEGQVIKCVKCELEFKVVR